MHKPDGSTHTRLDVAVGRLSIDYINPTQIPQQSNMYPPLPPHNPINPIFLFPPPSPTPHRGMARKLRGPEEIDK
jgi:hypothetical protein